MKKETPAPEQHPVDAYFREQETGIPVAFDPAHWDALQTMLDQAASIRPTAPGAHVSDLARNVAKPAPKRMFIRLLSLGMVFVFLAAVPSADKAERLVQEETGSLLPAREQAAPGLSTGEVTGQQPNGDGAPVTPTPTGTDNWPGQATVLPAAADTFHNQHLLPATLPLDSLYRQTDSLSIRKGLKAAQDSIAEQKKKKKHLFW